MRLLAVSCIAFVLSSAAWAIEDEATGLAINLPEQFIVEKTQPAVGYLVSFGVKNATGEAPVSLGEDYLCTVSFFSIPANADLPQAQINKETASDAWLDYMTSRLSLNARVDAVSAFTLRGITGQEFITTATTAQDASRTSVISFLQTPRGLTMISCVTDAAALGTNIELFDTIRDGVVPPA